MVNYHKHVRTEKNSLSVTRLSANSSNLFPRKFVKPKDKRYETSSGFKSNLSHVLKGTLQEYMKTSLPSNTGLKEEEIEQKIFLPAPDQTTKSVQNAYKTI